MSLLDRIISVEGLINTLRMKVVQAMNIFKSKNVVSYKVYSALMHQAGTDAPVAIVLENSIGDIVWTRVSLGKYFGTLSTAFPETRTWLIFNKEEKDSNSFLFYWLNSNTVVLENQSGEDDWLNNPYAAIEIRVYTTEVAAQTIPDILGNTGKYLRTDGSTLSWASPNIAPTLQDVLTNGSTIVSNATIDAGAYSLSVTSNSTTFNLIPPKRYVALLTQSGTSAPVATVLENTIGNIVWTRDSPGVYVATLASAFPQNRTVFFTGSPFVSIFWADESVLSVGTTNSSFENFDGYATNCPIKIEVYP